MTRLRFAPVACLLLIAAAAAYRAAGQDAPLPAEDPELAKLDLRVAQFLERASGGQPESALQELLAHSPLENQKDAIKKLTDQIRELESRYGKYRAFERIESRRVGKHLVLMKYLYSCDNYPVVWYFSFYHDFKRSGPTPDGFDWMLISVRFDTELELLTL